VTHYEVLGVPPGATVVEIRQAYLRLARRHHPDLVRDPTAQQGAEHEMRRINDAWATLGDAERRRAYDRSLGLPPPGETLHRPWVPHEPDDPDEVDPRDLLDDTPFADGGQVPRSFQLVPPLLLLASVVAIVVGAVTAIPGLLALGLVGGVAALVLFVVAPFVAMVHGRRAIETADEHPGAGQAPAGG
jgi:hypothetical protein